MELSLAGIFALVQYTLRNPRGGARHLLAMDIPDGGRWLAFVLVAVGSAIGTHLSISVMAPADRAMLETMFFSPFRTALMQAGIWLAIVALITAGGRMRGGRGRFSDGLLLIAWLQFILLCIQIAQVAAGLLLPPLADMIGLAGIALLLWLLTNFVAELHGFTSLWKVFIGIVLGAIVLFFAAAVLLAALVGAPVSGD